MPFVQEVGQRKGQGHQPGTLDLVGRHLLTGLLLQTGMQTNIASAFATNPPNAEGMALMQKTCKAKRLQLYTFADG